MLLACPYPQRSEEIKAFIRKHHYTHRCPGVYQLAHVIENHRHKICAAMLWGKAPYASIVQAFLHAPERYQSHLIFQQRMIGKGISRQELHELMRFALTDLECRDYWWALTYTDPTASTIAGTLISSPGYTGETYFKTNWQYLGMTAANRHITGYIIDGQFQHCRRGAVTYTLSNIHDHFPNAKVIRVIREGAKQRWTYLFARTEQERAQRILLMKYRIQSYEPYHQPRLLFSPFLAPLWIVR